MEVNSEDVILKEEPTYVSDSIQRKGRYCVITTQTSWRFPGLSTPWLLNFASRTTISATLSYKTHLVLINMDKANTWTKHTDFFNQHTLTKRLRADLLWAVGTKASIKDCAALLNSTWHTSNLGYVFHRYLKTCKVFPYLIFFDMWKSISAEKSGTAINGIPIATKNLHLVHTMSVNHSTSDTRANN